MNITLPLSMLRRISAVLNEASKGNRPIQVYAEAEKVRRIHPEANVALEDIIENFITMGRKHNVAFEIDPAHATAAVMGLDRH